MAVAVQMPKVGISVESCVLTKWHKKKGDAVSTGDLLFTYETDKSTLDEEAKVSGVLLDVFFNEGDDVPCMLNVAAIGAAGEDVSSFKPALVEPQAAGTEEAKEVKAEVKPEAAAVKTAAVAEKLGNAPVSPRARAAAVKFGIDPALAVPTGAEGRVVENDILAVKNAVTASVSAGAALGAAATGIGGRVRAADLPAAFSVPAAEYTDEKISGVRKFIAKSMRDSLTDMAQLTLHTTADATDILAFRKSLKEKGGALDIGNITVNDIVIYAVSRALKNHRAANAHFMGDTMRYFNAVNMGVAVDTEKGLLVPTLFNADKLSLSEISVRAKKLAADAVSGTLAPELSKGGTFTITNLGTLDVEFFTPVINPPQTCILGVGTLVTKVKEGADGSLLPYKALSLSLTFDHRALDGAPAARFLQEVKRNLESFSLLLAK